MVNSEFINSLAAKLAAVLPKDINILAEDLEKNFKDVLQNTFAKMNLVTREEFDIQTAVLARAREQLDELNKRLTQLEQNNNK